MNYFVSKLVAEIKTKHLGLLLTFAVYLPATIFASYLFRQVGTAPAVLFTAHGIALAAFILIGYVAAIPVALATLILGFINHQHPLLVSVSIISSVAQPALTLFLLRKVGFNRSLETTRDFVVLLFVSGVTSMIAPTSTVLSRALFNQYVGPTMMFSWEHVWVGVLLSCVIITPFILRWSVPIRKRTIAEWGEIVLVMALFVTTNYVLSYTPISNFLGVSLAIPFFVLPLWIALRAGSRFITLMMVATCIITFSGLFLGVHADTPANLRPIFEKIFSTEILFIFIALFYYILCAIEERRRAAVRDLAMYTEGLEHSLTAKELDDDAKNEFIAVLGHEIRNPLAAILSSVEIMRMSKDEVQRERLLESMEDRIRSMARLLDDIFDISRITRRKLRLKNEVVRARTVLRGAVESVEAYMRKNGHQFTSTFPDKNVLINADPVRIEQIVSNLLYNAAKYTPSGGLIDFKAIYENSVLTIRVRDTGVGLSEEEQDKIFEPFMQINPKQSLMGGVGLGLTLAKNLVEMHQGTIEVQSDGAGRGSEFIVRIPAHLGNPPVGKEPTVILPKPKADATMILVVDDNVDAAKGMGKLLELHGHSVEIAFTGQEALNKAQAHTPHGVILDIGLPDFDGYEVARKMRAAGNTAILIALSGYGHEDHKRKARDAGFDFFLTKPVSITEVVKIINAAPKPELGARKEAPAPARKYY